jgi:hypothetical protein
MSISIYDLTVPTFTKFLPALQKVLEKAEADAEARKIDPQVFLQARLAPDMFHLTRQVQICTDQVKGGLSRLANVEVPAWADDEASFADLQARLEKALAYAKTFKPKQFEGAEKRTIELKFPNASFSFMGQDYLLNFVLPNFYFHMTAAYAILRHNGVQIGKRDFLGG